MDDGDLVRRCLGGHGEAFEVLVERYQKPVYNAAFRMLNHAQDAEDTAQSAFLKAYLNLSSFDPSHRFFSWLYRITMNEALNLIKRRKRQMELVARGAQPADEGRLDAAVEAYEVRDRVETALMYLSPDDRAIIVLKHLEGLSYEEVGYVLDVPIRTVKSRLFTARQRLKDILMQRGLVHHDR